jgi:hypothetical protein
MTSQSEIDVEEWRTLVREKVVEEWGLLEERIAWKDQINWDDLAPPCAADDCSNEAEYIAMAILPGCCCHGKKYPMCPDCIKLTKGVCQYCFMEGGRSEIVERL